MFDKLKNIKFTTKLFVSIVFIAVASVAVIAVNAIRMSRDGLNEFGTTAIATTHQAVYDSIIMYDKSVRYNLEGDLRFFQREIASKGDVELISSSLLKQTMVNEQTNQSTTLEIPRLVIGATYVNGSNDFVDSIEKTVGVSAIIFQLVDDKLLRVSSTLKDQNGERAVGSFIPSDSPIYKTILRGETYKEKSLVVNSWYLTAYSPLLDWDDKIVGAIYVGRPLLNDQIKEYISTVKIGKGYFYLYEEDGSILLHPSLSTGSNVFDSVPSLKGHSEGSIRYPVDGEIRFTHSAPITPWGVYLATDLNEADIHGALDRKMIQTNLVAGFFVVATGIILTIFLVRSINRPLLHLAEKSIKVGEGDYTVDFHSDNKDAIGQLTNALGVMVEKSKEMIEDIVTSSDTLRNASHDLLDISGEMVESAESTTLIADNTSEDAANASSNINSISAAMEESATNLEIIASASDEMGNTIKEIAENSSKARQTTESAVQSALKSQETIHDLGEAAKAIGKVTETITDISEQTNLLALNATIEAARAGDAGKGFAVVANEIKELAKQTASATAQIKSAIDGMQQQTEGTIDDIQAISEVINGVNEIVTTIVTAVEEQAATTSEIATNVNQASLGINEINENVATGSQLTSSMSSGVGQVKEKSMAVKENSEKIRISAASLSELSDKLSDVVSRFHI